MTLQLYWHHLIKMELSMVDPIIKELRSMNKDRT